MLQFPDLLAELSVAVDQKNSMQQPGFLGQQLKHFEFASMALQLRMRTPRYPEHFTWTTSTGCQLHLRRLEPQKISQYFTDRNIRLTFFRRRTPLDDTATIGRYLMALKS